MTDILSSDFVPVVNRCAPQLQQLSTPVSINSRLSHSSHSVAPSKIFVFCTKRGFHGRYMLPKLVAPGAGVPTLGAKKLLDNLNRSQLSLPMQRPSSHPPSV